MKKVLGKLVGNIIIGSKKDGLHLRASDRVGVGKSQSLLASRLDPVCCFFILLSRLHSHSVVISSIVYSHLNFLKIYLFSNYEKFT